MKTKTIKTPLMMSVALGPTSCPSAHALKSKFLRMSEAQYDLVSRFSHHRGKTEKTEVLSLFFSEAKRNVVFPRMLSIVAKQRVMRAGLVQELALKHKALTSARKLVERKTADEGF